MNLLTAGSREKRGITEEDLLAAFADDEARGEYIILSDEDGSLLQAVGEGFGPYTLEFFPGERSGTHLKVCDELKRQEVRDAMLDYLRGGSAWRESHPWREVEDEKGEGCGGCLISVPAAILVPVPWLLIIAGIGFMVYALAKHNMGVREGGEARWYLAGLACLIIGVGFVLLGQLRRAPDTPGPKVGPPHDLE